jgi:hypothetical protein
MNKDLYNVYMTLKNDEDIWWQGYAIDGGDALNQAWEYAMDDYKCEPRAWDIEREEENAKI